MYDVDERRRRETRRLRRRNVYNLLNGNYRDYRSPL